MEVVTILQFCLLMRKIQLYKTDPPNFFGGFKLKPHKYFRSLISIKPSILHLSPGSLRFAFSASRVQ